MTGSADRALAIVRERAGAELAERLAHLDARGLGPRGGELPCSPPDAGATPDVDVVMAGGGLGLLVAAELARRGVSVAVLERARAGVAHREWNASRAELAPLVASGIVTEGELAELVVARYDEGFCAFHGGGRHVVRDVLDHAVDAGPLLARVRATCEARGVRFLDRAPVTGLGAGPASVRVAYEGGEILARMVLDARGASSPYAQADLVCPTVGGVLRGLAVGDGPRRYRPEVGEILVTTEGVEDGHQHVWEGFPGRAGELTVYLFAYARASATPPGALARLYARFFETLPRYKEGDAELVRPTFGYIPGWSRLVPGPASPSPRIVLVGDAAARHSPLTFCGFGSMLRTFVPVADSVVRALASGSEPVAGVPEEPVHAWTGALARLMASGKMRGESMNALLDAAFGTLAEMGQASYAALLKDRMDAAEFMTFLRRTAAKQPSVYARVLVGLGPVASARWGFRVAMHARGA